MEAKQIKKLLMVTAGANNNKYYDMYDYGKGTFTAKFGRIGSSEQVKEYSISQWEKKYQEKLKKGYVDRSDMLLVKEATTSAPSFADIKNRHIAKLVDALQAYANKSVAANYTVTAATVTELQVQEAQAILDYLTKQLKPDVAVKAINDKFLELYSVIPRKMRKVSDYLLDAKVKAITKDKAGKALIAQIEQMLSNEQATLDVMHGQVKISSKQNASAKDDSKTLIELMGIRIDEITPTEVETIQKLLGPNKKQFQYAFKVVNLKTQKSFDEQLKAAKAKQCELFWHGSRNENWWSIIEMGLLLRPTNAIINGKMFGHGIYFADKAQKSIGYSSLSGSYWARGMAPQAFLSLFNVHVGNQLRIKRHESWCYDLDHNKLCKRGAYDSLYAEGGADLINNEFIVYNQSQATIQYIIEITK